MLSFFMILANTVLLNSFGNVDTMPTRTAFGSQSAFVCLLMNIVYFLIFCIISICRSLGIIIQSPLKRIPFSIASSSQSHQ